MRNRIIHGEALEVLKTLPDESMNCCVTMVLRGNLGLGRRLERILPAWQMFLAKLGASYAAMELSG